MRTNAHREKSKNKILFRVFIPKTERAAHRCARKRSATVNKEEEFFSVPCIEVILEGICDGENL